MDIETRRASCVRYGAYALLLIGLAACPVTAADGTMALQPLAAPASCGVEPWIDLANGLAWPLAIAILVIWFRRPFAEFVAAVGARASKLQIAQLSIELANAREPARTPLLDEIRDPARSAQIGDSSQMLLEQARSTEPADFAVISLGQGDEWLTSRLFIAAVMMERMRGIKVFVFVAAGADTERRFVATADVRRLRWGLARRYPWLEVAYVQALAQVYQAEDPRGTSMLSITTDNGALEPYRAQQLVQGFIGAIQRPVGAMPAGGAGTGGQEWVTLEQVTQERAVWVTPRLLDELLPLSDLGESVIVRDDMSPARLSRAVLRRMVPFVALVNEKVQYLRLVDRRAYLESLAAQVGQEPE